MISKDWIYITTFMFILVIMAIAFKQDEDRLGLKLVQDGEIKIYRYTEKVGGSYNTFYFTKDKTGNLVPMRGR